ncbi:calcium-binding protein [Ensifer aridi]|uniref:calcium-binding protein n=1 Tax=Ensifer aridi TaxID=1708715 RepID=UPI000A110611|nr:calcium-binding protein [Ensifer aridi]
MRAYTFGSGIWSSPFHHFTSYDVCTGYTYWIEPLGACSQREGPPVVTKAVTADSALAVTVFGGADAFGLDTTASASASLRVVDRGLATFAIGSATFTAAARGNSAHATTYGGVAITGADLSMVSTKTVTASGLDGMTETTSLSFVALDLTFDLDCQVQAERSESHVLDGTNIGALQGNTAFFNVDATAAGENSFVDVQADMVVVEDALSTVTVSTTAAVSGEVAYTEIIGSSRPDRINTGLGDTLVFAGAGDDNVLAGAGDDWIFGGRGRDTVHGGAGSDTVLGEGGRDRLHGGEGADWIFGGEGDDAVCGGDGDDLLLGDDDDDTVHGGGGNDILCGGDGRDCLDGGAGDDIFRLGTQRRDDGNVYSGGSGSDLFLLVAGFDRDMIQDFSIAQSDRLAISDLDEVAAIGRGAFTMQRSPRDADDLVISFDTFDRCSELTLNEFFALNPSYNSMPRRGIFSDTQAAALLRAISLDADDRQYVQEAQMLLQLGDALSLLG